MAYIIGTIMIVCTIAVYACCIAAGRADDRLAEYDRQYGGECDGRVEQFHIVGDK